MDNTAIRDSKLTPYEAVIFEMELVSTEPAPPQVINAAPSPTISSGIIKVPSKEGMEKGEKVETIDPSAVPAAK